MLMLMLPDIHAKLLDVEQMLRILWLYYGYTYDELSFSRMGYISVGEAARIRNNRLILCIYLSHSLLRSFC